MKKTEKTILMIVIAVVIAFILLSVYIDDSGCDCDKCTDNASRSEYEHDNSYWSDGGEDGRF